MSGRKKNRRPQHGQPPHELLRELNSLRELLGSDMEADIPLLDQVADASGEQKTGVSIQNKTPPYAPGIAPRQAPRQPQRPLAEMDLPILFSPVDEEPLDDFEDYTPTLSAADLELLRPLQNLPRREPEVRSAEPKPIEKQQADGNNRTTAAQQKPQSNLKEPPKDGSLPAKQPAKSPRDEVQPGLFELEQEKSPTIPAPSGQAPAEQDVNSVAEVKSVAQVTAKPIAPGNLKASTAPMTENPFLPPHIRARLTGGRVPRSESVPAPAAAVTSAALRKPEPAPPCNRTLSEDERERLIEQLVAEQLPDLERQLRLGITLMLDELYPRKS